MKHLFSFLNRHNHQKADKGQSEKTSYRAFISYRHLPKDRMAAILVHRMLERYIIPKELRSHPEEKYIGHIFRDQDELPLSSDLSASIREALDTSELLIVICTPQTAQSKWVNEEIDTFLKSNSRDRIVAVLADGEPEESFPIQLRYKTDPDHPDQKIEVEPLAADIRAKTKASMAARLRTEKLRIMAQILNVPFDSLVQRDKTYRMRRLMTASLAFVLVLSLFTAYILNKNAQIQSMYHASQLSLAEASITQSEEAMAKGDRIEAISKAMSVLDDQGNPLLPGQYNTLAQAVGAYRTRNFTLLPQKKVVLPFIPDKIEDCSFSTDGKWGLFKTYDQTMLADLETGEMTWKMKAVDFDPRFAASRGGQSVDWAQFLDHQTVLVQVENAIFKANLDTRTIEGKAALTKQKDKSFDTEAQLQCLDGNTACFMSNQQIWLLDTDSMELKGTAQLPEMQTLDKVLLSSDHQKAAFTDGGFNKDTRLFVADFTKDDPVTLITEYSADYFVWTDKGELIYSARQGSIGTDDFSRASFYTWNGETKSDPWGEMIVDEYPDLGTAESIRIDGEKYPVYCEGSTVKVLDGSSRKIIWEDTFLFNIDQVMGRDNFYFFLNSRNEFGGRDLYQHPMLGASFPEFSLLLESDLNLSHVTFVQQDQASPTEILALYFEGSKAGVIRYGLEKNEDGLLAESGELIDVLYSELADGRKVRFVLTRTDDIYHAALYDRQDNNLIMKRDIEVQPGRNPDRIPGLYYSPSPGIAFIPNMGGTGQPGFVWNDGKSVHRAFSEDRNEDSTVTLEMGPVLSFSCSTDGNHIFVSYYDKPDSLNDDSILQSESDAQSEEHFYIDDLTFHSGLYVWNPSEKTYTLAEFLDLPAILSSEFSDDGQFVILSGDGILAAYDIQKQKLVDLEGHSAKGNWIENVAVSQDSYRQRTVTGRSSGYQTSSTHPWIVYLTMEKPDQNESWGSERKGYLCVQDLVSGQRIHQIPLVSLGFNDFFKNLQDNAAFFDQDRKVLLYEFRGSEEGSYYQDWMITQIDLESKEAEFKFPVAKNSEAPDRLKAGKTGLTLHHNDCTAYGPETGSVRKTSGYYRIIDGTLHLEFSVECQDLFVSEEQNEILIRFNDRIYARELLSFDQLCQMAEQIAENFEITVWSTEDDSDFSTGKSESS